MNMRRPFKPYIWLDHNNKQRHCNDMLNDTSEKKCLAEATKEGTKWPATKQISIMSLGVRKEKRTKPPTGGYKQGH